MTGIWWVDLIITVVLVYVIVYVKPYDDRPSTLEKAEVEELERMWKR